MKDRVIALVDGNNFFAGCEILRNPGLKGKPVCVLSNNDGCVIARSNEAKKLGITMGMPYFKAKPLFPQAVYLSADFTLYHDLSDRMIYFLNNFSDKIDVYSIDEAFLDITGLDMVFNLDYEKIAKKIKEETEEATGVSVSVGIANTKTLAKLASHKAKVNKGYFFISKDNIKTELENLEISEIWGIGRNLTRRLKTFGIFYADELILKDDEFYRYNFGKKGCELKYELSGISVLPVTGIVEKSKSIQRTRALPDFSRDVEYIKAELNMHIHSVCKKLREEGSEAFVIGLMLRTKDFRVYFKDIKLDVPTNCEIEFIRRVYSLFYQMYVPEITYRSAGVYAGELTGEIKQQLNFFTDESAEKLKRISATIDKIEIKFGKYAVSIGKTGIKSVREKHKRKSKTL